MLLKILAYGSRSCLGNHRSHLRVTQLCLCLSFELRFLHLDRNYRGETLAEILRSKVGLEIFQQIVRIRIVSQSPRKAHLKALEMRTTFYRVDIVDVGIDFLAESGVILESDVDRNPVAAIIDADRLRGKFFGAGVNIVNKFTETVFRKEDVGTVDLAACCDGIPVGIHIELVNHAPHVRQRDADALVQVG